MPIDNDALIKAIDAARENTYGTDESSDLARKRAKAIEYYLGMNTNPAPQGRSQVVDRSVYETISVKLPSLVRIFAGSSEEVCKAVAIGPDDEPAAEQQTAVLNYIVSQQNQWEQIVGDWIHDTLLLANGYCFPYWDATKRTVKEPYNGQSDDQLAALMQDPDVKVVEHTESIDEEGTAEAQQAFQQSVMQWQQMAQQASATGQPPPPQPQPPGQVLKHDVVIERQENKGQICIKTLPPEHCRISEDTPDWTLRDCPYFEYREQKTIADIRSMDLDVDEDVSDDEDQTEEDKARDRFGEDRLKSDGAQGVMRRVWTRMIWVRADAEGDGESRLYYVIAVGKTILFSEQCSRIQVASMTAQPLPHRHIGLSEAETVFDIQDIRTAVTRGGLDNLYLANNGRHVISSKVNLADFLDSRPGSVIRMLNDQLPGEGHVVPLTHPFVFDQIVGSLEYFDQIRQNRTGASRYFSGTDAGAINKTASGTMALQNMASMRVEHQARVMAPAVEDLFSIVQELAAKHQNKAMTIKLRAGKWVTVDPQAWRTKRDMRISVGVGAGNKETMQAQLNDTLMAQVQLMPLGLAGPNQIHSTLVEKSKLSGFANPDKFWLNPAEQPPQAPAPPPPELLKLQVDQEKNQQQRQTDAENAQIEMQRLNLEREKLMLQASDSEKDRQVELEKTRMQEATKLALGQLTVENQSQTMASNQNFEATKMAATFQREDQAKQEAQQKDGGMNELLNGVQQALAALADKMTGSQTVKAEKIRDANGKVIGAKIVQADGTTREVQIQ